MALLDRITETAHLKAEEQLYCIVDPVQAPELANWISFPGGLSSRVLFDGSVALRAQQVAPRLVLVNRCAEFFDRWSALLGSSAGILLASRESFEVVWEHVRGIFVAEDEGAEAEDSKEEWFFRFFDPRVLRPMLPSLDNEERTELFGPVRAMIVESPDGKELDICTDAKTGLARCTIFL